MLSAAALALILAPFAQAAHAASPHTTGWTLTGHMNADRTGHTATLLNNGTVLVVGGDICKGWGKIGGCPVYDAAELYMPSLNIWWTTGSPLTDRWFHTATLLHNGMVLIAGGLDANGNELASAELYNPSVGNWTATGSMHVARDSATATLLPNGNVLVAGGSGAGLDAEVYNPSTGTWSTTGAMLCNYTPSTVASTANLLPNKQVLFVGGGCLLGQLYNPSTGTWAESTPLGPVWLPPGGHAATVLLLGQILITGGGGCGNNIDPRTGYCYSGSPPVTTAAETFWAPGHWYTESPMEVPRAGHTATILKNNDVLVAGGAFGYQDSSAELYDPYNNTWTYTASMNYGRVGHTATLMPNGQVLVVGGDCCGIAELYTP